MRILPHYLCIYIHIPKTAGNSVTEALDRLPEGRALHPDNLPPVPKHMKARDLKAALGDDMWAEYFSFTFVRNPWDQMVSSYNWWLQKAPGFKRNAEAVAEIRAMSGFDDFIRSPYGSTMINEMEGNSFDWVSDEDGQVIVDFVGRFESLSEDWGTVCERLGADVIELPHLNQTQRTHYRDYYSDETRDMVGERFRRTIETYGYAF